MGKPVQKPVGLMGGGVPNRVHIPNCGKMFSIQAMLYFEVIASGFRGRGPEQFHAIRNGLGLESKKRHG